MYKVLVIAPSWLGDLIMTQALFKILYQQGKTVEVLAPRWNHAILACMPEVSKAIAMPFEHGDLKIIERYKFAKKIQKNNYDECIVIPNSFKSALIPYWSKIKKRTGWLGEFRYGLLNNTQKLNKAKLPLMVQRIIALANMGASLDQDHIASINYDYPSLQISKDLINNTYNKFDIKFNIESNNNILVLAPGAAYGETKKWPAQYYAKIALDKLTQGWQVIILGSPKDKAAADLVNQKTDNQCINLAGKLELPETVAIISQATVIISNDSGLLHVAAALDRPLIGIYGSTSPDFTPPLIRAQKKAIVKLNNLACSPCFKSKCKYGHLKCLYDIKPELVTTAINNLIIK